MLAIHAAAQPLCLEIQSVSAASPTKARFPPGWVRFHYATRFTSFVLVTFGCAATAMIALTRRFITFSRANDLLDAGCALFSRLGTRYTRAEASFLNKRAGHGIMIYQGMHGTPLFERFFIILDYASGYHFYITFGC